MVEELNMLDIHSIDNIERKEIQFSYLRLEKLPVPPSQKSVSHGLGLLKFIKEAREDVLGDFCLLKEELVRIRLQTFNLAIPHRISAPLLGPLKELARIEKITLSHV